MENIYSTIEDGKREPEWKPERIATFSIKPFDGTRERQLSLSAPTRRERFYFREKKKAEFFENKTATYSIVWETYTGGITLARMECVYIMRYRSFGVERNFWLRWIPSVKAEEREQKTN